MGIILKKIELKKNHNKSINNSKCKIQIKKEEILWYRIMKIHSNYSYKYSNRMMEINTNKKKQNKIKI